MSNVHLAETQPILPTTTLYNGAANDDLIKESVDRLSDFAQVIYAECIEAYTEDGQLILSPENQRELVSFLDSADRATKRNSVNHYQAAEFCDYLLERDGTIDLEGLSERAHTIYRKINAQHRLSLRERPLTSDIQRNMIILLRNADRGIRRVSDLYHDAIDYVQYALDPCEEHTTFANDPQPPTIDDLINPDIYYPIGDVSPHRVTPEKPAPTRK